MRDAHNSIYPALPGHLALKSYINSCLKKKRLIPDQRCFPFCKYWLNLYPKIHAVGFYIATGLHAFVLNATKLNYSYSG